MQQTVDPLVFFALEALKAHYTLAVEAGWSWDGYDSFNDMIGAMSAEVAKAMLAQKILRSDQSEIDTLDIVAAGGMQSCLLAAYEHNYTYEGYETWEHMIASNAYDMAASVLMRLI